MSPFDPAWESGPDYADAALAACLLAIDPGLGGILVRGGSSPAREHYLAAVRNLFPAGTPIKKIPLNITEDRLLGGIDLAATLATGKLARQRGLLAEVPGGVLVVAMAERQSAVFAAQLAAARDAGADFCILALDESGPDEAPPTALTERLAFTVGGAGATDFPAAATLAAARQNLRGVVAGEDMLERLCQAAAWLGIASPRAEILALRAARAACAMRGSSAVADADVELAVKLVLLPRATQRPQPPAPETPETLETPETPEHEAPEQNAETVAPLQDRLEEAQAAALPENLLALLAGQNGPRRAQGAGKSGKLRNFARGRPAGTRPGALKTGARLSLLETLRAAAPWQKCRRHRAGQKVAIRGQDFRIRIFKQQPRRLTVFAVDASGSSALNRLAEAKGAIQLLLAQCYVRRDEVALLAFRGAGAELLLPPTHALSRAKRCLAALPGGGATPLAAGLSAARELAEAATRRGQHPLLVLLTDGGANIGRDGKPGRAAAARDALAIARSCQNLPSLVVDISPRANGLARELSTALGGRYLALPYLDAAKLHGAVSAFGSAYAL